jgi:hypothetical protein
MKDHMVALFERLIRLRPIQDNTDRFRIRMTNTIRTTRGRVLRLDAQMMPCCFVYEFSPFWTLTRPSPEYHFHCVSLLWPCDFMSTILILMFSYGSGRLEKLIIDISTNETGNQNCPSLFIDILLDSRPSEHPMRPP